MFFSFNEERINTSTTAKTEKNMGSEKRMEVKFKMLTRSIKSISTNIPVRDTINFF